MSEFPRLLTSINCARRARSDPLADRRAPAYRPPLQAVGTTDVAGSAACVLPQENRARARVRRRVAASFAELGVIEGAHPVGGNRAQQRSDQYALRVPSRHYPTTTHAVAYVHFEHQLKRRIAGDGKGELHTIAAR